MSLATIREREPMAAWAIAHTLALEGGLVDSPQDPGGVTDFGLSLRWALADASLRPEDVALLDSDHDGEVDRQDIRGLTADRAADVYYGCWWLRGFYRQLAPALVAWKCFDIAVNTGPRRAGILLQTALRFGGLSVAVDGDVGPQTLRAAASEAARDEAHALMAALRDQQAAFYRNLAMAKPQLSPFLKGWLRRAAA